MALQYILSTIPLSQRTEPTSNVNSKVAAVKVGKIKKGSHTVRSVNQNNPPVFILSTGKFAIPRKPQNTPKNIGNCKKSRKINKMKWGKKHF